MRIAGVSATTVRVPVTRLAAFTRRKMSHVVNTIVEVETDAGITGLGETRGAEAKRLIDERFAPALAGLDVHDRVVVHDACLPREPFDHGYLEHPQARSVYAAIEMALWDAAAKDAGQPLYRYWGGAVRERAPFVGYAYAVDPDEGHPPEKVAEIMAEIARESIARTGAAMFELKVGLHPPMVEADVVRAVRAALGPRIEIAVDANTGFTVEAARRFLFATLGHRLANIEEPVARLADMARLRSDFPVPVSTHCADLDALAAHPAIDAVVSDPWSLGGAGPTLRFAAQAAAIGKRFWLRARWELGVAWACLCHIGMAAPEIDRPSQALIDWVEDDCVEGDPWLVTRGGVRPPDAPGLGVALDRGAMERYRAG